VELFKFYHFDVKITIKIAQIYQLAADNYLNYNKNYYEHYKSIKT
jgi:hypothetical protein